MKREEIKKIVKEWLDLKDEEHTWEKEDNGDETLYTEERTPGIILKKKGIWIKDDIIPYSCEDVILELLEATLGDDGFSPISILNISMSHPEKERLSRILEKIKPIIEEELEGEFLYELL